MTSAGIRRRRSGQEIRELVLAASAELFAEQGYTLTRTRDVALRAGVTEHAIYRHFGSKAALYQAVVTTPLAHFVESYLADVERFRDDLALEDVVERFVRGFLGLLREHRDTLLTVLSARADADPAFRRVAAEVRRHVTDGLEQTRALLERTAAQHGLSGVDTTHSWAAMIAMILSMAIHADMLYPAGQEPAEDDQVTEMVTMILHGIGHRP